MAATAQIVIEVDDSGATQAFQRVNAEAGKLGPTLKPVQQIADQTFSGIEQGSRKGREAAVLLTEQLGIRMPRALANVISDTSLIGPAMEAAFSTVAVVAFIQLAFQAGQTLGDFTAKIREGGRDMAAVFESVLQTSRKMQGPQTFQEMAALVTETTKRTEDLRKQLGLTGDFLPGLVAPVRRLGAQFEYSYLELQRLEKSLPGLQSQLDQLADAAKRTEPVEILKLQNQARLAGLQGIARINEEERGATAVLKAEIAARMKTEATGQAEITNVHAQAAAKRTEFERGLSDKTKQLQNQATLSALTGLDAIREKAKEEIDAELVLYERGKTSWQAYQAAKVAITQRTQSEINKVEHDAAAQGQQAILQAEAEGLAGRAQIEAAYVAQLHQIDMREQQLHIVLDGERIAAAKTETNKLLDLERQRADEEIQLNTAASIAMLPPWRRADAQLVADAAARIQKIQELEDKDKDFVIQGEREKADIVQKLWADRVDSMANQLETLYNDITSGGIGKFFLEQFKKMVFQMVAQWIIGMTQMRAASQQQMGSGGGILGSIFGALGLGKIFGGSGGPGGTPTFLGNLFDAGTSGAPTADINALTGLGALSGLPSFSGGDTGTAGGIGSSLSGALGISAGLSPGTSGIVLPSGAGPAGAAAGGIGSILAKIFPKGISIGGQTISGLALASMGIGLVANSFGKGGVLGGLEGAAGGALTGLMFGPVGAAIGAIVGFFAGFISHSTKKARLQIEANIKDQAQKIEDAYNLFQTDAPTSLTALETLRQQGVDALKQAGVKDISRSRVGHVDHWVDKAEKDINATQAERDSRSAIGFGPAQFRAGGFVGAGIGGAAPAWFTASAMHFAGGGAVPAFLHENEYVLRSEAVSRIGVGRLDRMNAGGGASGDTHLHFEINAIDAKSFDSYLANGGMKSIAKAWHRAKMEGGF